MASLPKSDNVTSKSARTRQRILDAAANVFRQRGYALATLSEIAERADMQAGSLYYHFASKEELLEEVFETGVANVHNAVQRALKDLEISATPAERLRCAITTHFEVALERGDYSAANLRLLSHIPDEIRQRHLRSQRRYGRLWQKLVNDGMKSGAFNSSLNPSIVRMLILGAINWSVEWYEPAGASPTTIAEHLIDLLHLK